MKAKRPLILISNDDGYLVKGINCLVDYLRPLGDIVVMAPDGARSGAACSLTMHAPIHYELVSQSEGLTIYKCSGTPTECVKLALVTVLDRQPDLVIGGINHGDNSAVNVHYSGTMGVTIEGCLKGISSIAFSLCSHDAHADFEPLKPYITDITRKVLERGLPPLTCLNVNFPVATSFKGIRVCEQAKGQWTNEWQQITHRGDDRHFWLTGEFVATDPDNPRSDYRALADGYVAITPTTVDATAYQLIDELKNWF